MGAWLIGHCTTLGTSHTKLVVSEWYARVSLPMRSMECSRCLREVLYTYILDFLPYNGMPPEPIFSIYWCVRPSLLTCAGAQITRFRRGCMENILRRSIPFFKTEQPFYTYSIDLLILQEGLRYLIFELQHVEHGQICISGAFTTCKATTSGTRAAIQCASRDPNRTTVV